MASADATPSALMKVRVIHEPQRGSVNSPWFNEPWVSSLRMSYTTLKLAKPTAWGLRLLLPVISNTELPKTVMCIQESRLSHDPKRRIDYSDLERFGNQTEPVFSHPG